MRFLLCVVLFMTFISLWRHPAVESYAITHSTTESEGITAEVTTYRSIDDEAEQMPLNNSTNQNNNYEISAENTTEDEAVLSFEPTKIQQDVLTELENIWDFSESLQETEAELKSSLMSLVHLTYARIQSEPEEMLDRLKYLLTKLRSKLNGTTEEVDSDNTSARMKRSLSVFHQDGTNEIDNFLTSNILDQLNIDLDEEISTKLSPSTSNTTIKPKIMTFTKRPVNQEIPVGEPFTTSAPILAGKNYSNEINGSYPIITVDSQLEQILIQLIHNGSCNNISIPFDFDLSALIRNNTNLTMVNMTENILGVVAPSFISESIGINLEVNDLWKEDPDLYLCSLAKIIKRQKETNQSLPDEIGQGPVGSKVKFPPLPLPSYFENLIGTLVQENEEMTNLIDPDDLKNSTIINYGPASLIIREKSTVSPTQTSTISTVLSSVSTPNTLENEFQTSDDYYYDFMTGFDEVSNVTELTRDNTSILLNFLTQLTAPSEIDPMFETSSMFNGTRDGLIRFIIRFNQLRKPTKIIIIFIISITIISMGAGAYKFGPPIILLGALSSLLPLLLLTLLERDEIGRKLVRERKKLQTEVEDYGYYVTKLISEARIKYNP